MSETQGIHKAMLAVMKQLGGIGKNQKVEHGGTFNYRGVDDIYNRAHAVLVDCGVIILPQVLEQTTEDKMTSTGKPTMLATVRVKYVFYAADGSSIEAITAGAATDNAGRAIAQAQSDAYKQAIFKTFCVPTYDEDAEKNLEQMADPAIDAAWKKMVAKFGDGPTRTQFTVMGVPYNIVSLRAVYKALAAQVAQDAPKQPEAVADVAEDLRKARELWRSLCEKHTDEVVQVGFVRTFGKTLAAWKEDGGKFTLDMMVQLEEALKTSAAA